jgi:hypothetical protein
MEWCDETLIPEAKKYQENTGKFGKILLIVDNASHPCSVISERENRKFKVMARGTTETLRKLHRKQLFENSFIV